MTEYSQRQKLKNAYGGDPTPELGYAVKAWREGTASEDQQILVYKYVVEVLCGLTDPALAAPGDIGMVNWINGRRSVGLQLNELANTPVKSFT